jgi:hypothetical protein
MFEGFKLSKVDGGGRQFGYGMAAADHHSSCSTVIRRRT